MLLYKIEKLIRISDIGIKNCDIGIKRIKTTLACHINSMYSRCRTPIRPGINKDMHIIYCMLPGFTPAIIYPNTYIKLISYFLP
jgi:hypothetical protein